MKPTVVMHNLIQFHNYWTLNNFCMVIIGSATINNTQTWLQVITIIQQYIQFIITWL